MKMTLLQLTQNILSAMDAEEVTAITDTVESMQVAEEIRNTYYENFGNFELKSRLELISLVDITDVDGVYKNILKIPDAVDKIKWIKYNVGALADPEWKQVTYITPEEFVENFIVMAPTGAVNAQKDLTSGLVYYVNIEKQPEFWTSFDDEHVVFDSFVATVDTQIDLLKTMVYAEVIPAFTLADATVPDLEDKFFPMLLAEAKSACFVNYKGVANSKEEQRSRRQRVHHQNNRSRYNEHKEYLYNYGRS